jgi:hypothetical protein
MAAWIVPLVQSAHPDEIVGSVFFGDGAASPAAAEESLRIRSQSIAIIDCL